MRVKLLILISIFHIHIFAQKYIDFGKSVFVKNDDSLFYRVYFPDSLEQGRKYPLIVYLHGMGSRGKDNWRQLIHGSKFLKDTSVYNNYPAVVLFPQCPKSMMWTNREKEKIKGKWVYSFPVSEPPTLSAEMANLLVDNYLKHSYIDSSKVYVLGMSMGGIGVLEFIYRWQNKYAAAAVVCGGHNKTLTQTYCHIPIWFFHGKKDRTVPYKYSKEVYEKLQKCNKDTKYTLYEKIAHNCWDSAYSNPNLLKWLYGFSRKQDNQPTVDTLLNLKTNKPLIQVIENYIPNNQFIEK